MVESMEPTSLINGIILYTIGVVWCKQMKIRVVSSREEINTLSPNEEIVHFSYRPSNTNILELVMKCPQVKALHIPKYLKRIFPNL